MRPNNINSEVSVEIERLEKRCWRDAPKCADVVYRGMAKRPAQNTTN
jgi:hypothetical protein